MRLRAALPALFVLSACAAPGGPPPAPPAERPNILVILADDLAAWHLGCYGNREIRTPNIDRLAAGGTRMANAFVCTPICSPSRATFFTGRAPRQHGICDFLTQKPEPSPPQGQAAPPPSFAEEIMISDLLAETGYRCGYIGKWHMGGEETPQHHYDFWDSWARGGGAGYNDPRMCRNGVIVQEKGYSTELWTRDATGFLREGPADARPWFLVIGYFNPHTPYEGHPQRYYDLYKDTPFDTVGIEPRAPNALREAGYMDNPVAGLRKAAASTAALDDQIPVLLRALAETGQRSRTLVVFAGDNGFLYGRHGAWSKGHATNPINMYEEVLRVPLIFDWPGRLAGGRTLDRLVSFYDILPTLCEAAGVDPARLAAVARERNLCGTSCWPSLLGRPQPGNDAVFCNFRYADAVCEARYKLILRHDGQGPNELFDLEADPREKRNRFDDPELAGVQRRLASRLAAWVRRYR